MNMTGKKPESCINCGRPIGKGGAKGLDARCYKYNRDHGVLPPAALMVGDKGGRFDVRFEDVQADAMSKAAKLEGITVSEWIRRACQFQLEIAQGIDGVMARAWPAKK